MRCLKHRKCLQLFDVNTTKCCTQILVGIHIQVMYHTKDGFKFLSFFYTNGSFNSLATIGMTL